MITAMQTHHWEQLNQVMPMVRQEDTRGVVALDENGRLLGGIVCEDWTETMCSAHIVLIDGYKALKMGLHKELANFVFTQAGKLKIMGLVPADNEKALKLDKHLGFTELFRIENGYKPDVDYVVMELKRENCPYWAEVDYGQESSRAA